MPTDSATWFHMVSWAVDIILAVKVFLVIREIRKLKD